MTATIRRAAARAFPCWPSRIGATTLLLLTTAWGSGLLPPGSQFEGAPRTVASVAE